MHPRCNNVTVTPDLCPLSARRSGLWCREDPRFPRNAPVALARSGSYVSLLEGTMCATHALLQELMPCIEPKHRHSNAETQHEPTEEA